MLKVHNDIIISIDKGEITSLTLLDLSAVFDTIDHATLTDRHSTFGLKLNIWAGSNLVLFLFEKLTSIRKN